MACGSRTDEGLWQVMSIMCLWAFRGVTALDCLLYIIGDCGGGDPDLTAAAGEEGRGKFKLPPAGTDMLPFAITPPQKFTKSSESGPQRQFSIPPNEKKAKLT